MPKRSQKRKAPASADTSFLAKLQLLRNFVGSNFSESDLSGCLRQCGFNIELAAERLMTGEYQRKPTSSSKSALFAAAQTPSNKKSTTTSNAAASSANKRHRVTPATTAFSAKKPPPIASSSYKSTGPAALPAPPSVNTLPATPPTSQNHHLWLCERWVVGLSTTKNGHFRYQERFNLSHSLSGPAMVRFRGNGMEGTLPPNVCALLTPLLREEKPLVSLEAHALMEEQGVPIGGDVPLCLRIYIEDPVAFFNLFETNAAPDENAASQFFGTAKKKGRGRPRKPTRLPIAEAAFALLQMAQYGDDSTFEPLPPHESKETFSEECESENDDSSVAFQEDDFEAGDSEGPEWAKSIAGETGHSSHDVELPEASDPVGFTDDVVLRAYQRQALYWMMQRENGSDNREELEKELSLLAELSRNTPSRRNLPPEPMKDDIVCEVGPVQVSSTMALKSCTIGGVENPVNHPLWQRRFLASADKKRAASFYVNELLGTASSEPPNPPRHCVGGILADAMGLGKTVMLLALILKDKEMNTTKNKAIDECSREMTADEDKPTDGENEKQPTRGSVGTTLVVAPLSLVSQWEEELATKTDLTHRVYYAESTNGGIHSKSFKGVDVVVTTYGTIQGELLASKRTGSVGSGLLLYEWRRVILDESHCIKNPTTIVSRACCALKAERRWCVTGTPIQNSLQDVYALIKFLRHEPWCEAGFWKAAITNADKEASDDETNNTTPSNFIGTGRVKRLLAPLILRRSKDTLDKNGQPILTLPPIETVTIDVELSVAEREFYNSLLEKSQAVFEGFLRSGTASKSWFAIFSLLNRLRQTCDHVALTVKSQLNDDEWNPDTLEMTSPRRKVTSPTANRASNASKGKDGLGDEFLESLLEKFRSKQDKENVETKYASQVARALAKTIESSATTMDDECPICLDRPLVEETVVTPCAHIFCRDCLVGILNNTASQSQCVSSLTQSSGGTCPSCNEPIDTKGIITLSKSGKGGRVSTSYLQRSLSPTKTGKVKAESKEDATHLGARQTLEKSLRGAGSSKLTAVISELHKVWGKDPRSKVLIFSQYLGFLDLLEVALRNHGIPSGRLDGKLSLKERVSVLEKFRQASPPGDDEDDRSSRIGSVLLMSMKAGGVGINMVAASTAFICDPWYNAAVEDQCISRIHRIGQTAKLVRVRKFIVADSVEERIVLLQRRKKDIACEILSDSNHDGSLSNNNVTPTLEDFKTLFGN